MDLQEKELIAVIETAVQIERDFLVKEGGPVLAVLARAREESALALARLVTVDPNEPRDIIALQNDIQRYRDLVRWLAETIQAAKDAEPFINEEVREDLREVLGLTESDDQ